MKVAIIGDFDPGKVSHVATNEALQHSADRLGILLDFEWIATNMIKQDFDHITKTYNSFWIAPGGIYSDVNAVLEIIRYARINNKPTIGTCGGFQYMVIEFARNVIGIRDAEHAESNPNALNLVINPLSCNLKGSPLEIVIRDEASIVGQICRTKLISESYYCSYGLNPEFQNQINSNGFKIVGSDNTGEVRILELQGHDFFIATLFVPQVSSTSEQPNKLITAFLRAASQ